MARDDKYREEGLIERSDIEQSLKFKSRYGEIYLDGV